MKLEIETGAGALAPTQQQMVAQFEKHVVAELGGDPDTTMATQHTDDFADRLAQDLYGRFLNRHPDPDGHKYVAQSLREGRKSVLQHVLEIVGSEEFRTKFVRNRSREQVVQHLHMMLLGQKVTDPYRLARQAAEFTLLDLVPYAERLTGSQDYRRLYGEDRLPGLEQATA